MKSYPSIPYGTECHVPIIAFDKLDGSNIRAEWSKKKGWYKFGTRKHLLDTHDPILGSAINLILEKYGEELSSISSFNKWERAIFFFEFYGENSFAGQHDSKDKKTVTLIDAAPYKIGILDPWIFLEHFHHLDIPTLLFEGTITQEFINSVKDSSLRGMTFEGVVCKGSNDKKTKMPILFKQKSKAWLDKLKDLYKDNDHLFEELK